MNAKDDNESVRARSALSREFVRFVDTAGVRWEVWERDARGDTGAHQSSCLIFLSNDVIRRVWEYPPGWRELGTDALVALSWHR